MVVARRVQAIDRSHPDAEHEAFRIFLEAVLIAELGEPLANDPAFHQLVDRVFEQMRANPPVAAMMGEASAKLLDVNCGSLE